MEAGGGVSTAPALRAAPEGPEDRPGGCSPEPEPPSTDPGKLQALPIGPGAHRAALAPRSPGGQAAVSPAKIPNRDSGIDSPTRSAPAGPFSCQEGSEAGGPTLLALHPEAAPGSKTTRKEANSDMGQDGGQEPAPESSPPGACADLAKVGCPPAQDGAPPGGLSEVAVPHSHLVPVVGCLLAEAPGRVGGADTPSRPGAGAWLPVSAGAVPPPAPWACCPPCRTKRKAHTRVIGWGGREGSRWGRWSTEQWPGELLCPRQGAQGWPHRKPFCVPLASRALTHKDRNSRHPAREALCWKGQRCSLEKRGV